MSTPLQTDSLDRTGLTTLTLPNEIFRFNTNQDNVHVARKWCRSTFGDYHGWELTYTITPYKSARRYSSMIVIIIYDNHPWELDKIKVMLALRWL